MASGPPVKRRKISETSHDSTGIASALEALEIGAAPSLTFDSVPQFVLEVTVTKVARLLGMFSEALFPCSVAQFMEGINDHCSLMLTDDESLIFYQFVRERLVQAVSGTAGADFGAQAARERVAHLRSSTFAPATDFEETFSIFSAWISMLPHDSAALPVLLAILSQLAAFCEPVSPLRVLETLAARGVLDISPDGMVMPRRSCKRRRNCSDSADFMETDADDDTPPAVKYRRTP